MPKRPKPRSKASRPKPKNERARSVSPSSATIQSLWSSFVSEEIASGGAIDPSAIVQAVLRESYEQTTEDLHYFAEKVKRFNQSKKAIRDYLQALRDLHVELMAEASEQGIDLCRRSAAAFAKLIARLRRPYKGSTISRELCIPNRVPPAGVNDLASLSNEIARWEAKLNEIGDDSQLANVDLQNALQKQQQTLQMMSNISKMLYDTAQSVIRKMGG